MPATPVIVPKKGALKNPDQLAANVTAGSAGAGITLAGLRYGYGPADTPPNKGKSLKPMFGVAGAEGGGTQSADAGAHTVFPSQFAFPATKWRREAGW